MKPQNGNFVTIFFYDQTQAEGFVISWEDDLVVLTSKDESIILRIEHPQTDIKMTKITQPAIKEVSYQPKEIISTQQQFQQTLEQPSQDPLRVKNLSQLRILMTEQEKQIITNKIKEHTPTTPSGTIYGSPFLTQPILK